MKTLIVALLVAGCAENEPLAYPLGPPPQIEHPYGYYIATDPPNGLPGDMTWTWCTSAEEYRLLKEDLDEARAWMEQADALLHEAGVDTDPLPVPDAD